MKKPKLETCSRYNDPQEIRELSRFADLAEIMGLEHYIKEVFYDTKCNTAFFKFFVEPKNFDPIFCAVEKVALMTLSQFVLGGIVYHGGRWSAHEWRQLERSLTATLTV